MGDRPDARRASFLYDEATLNDFEAMYRARKAIPTSMRAVLGALGAAGALFFGWKLYKGPFQPMHVAYLLVSSVLLVLAFSRADKRRDDAPARYRKGYLNRHATFTFGDAGLELRLEGQKNYARSKYREVYGLFETDLCYYLAIQGRAYYIIPRAAAGEDFGAFIEKKCGKKFQRCDPADKA